MSKKRKLFDELIQGIEDMRAHREGKITFTNPYSTRFAAAVD